MRESEIEKYFVWSVERTGGKTYKFKSPTQRGVSDRLACMPDGSTWFVELKAPKGKLSPLQVIFRDEVLDLHQKYALLNSKEKIDEWINQRRHYPHSAGIRLADNNRTQQISGMDT